MNKSSIYVLISGITWGLISIFVNNLAQIGFGTLEIVSLRVLISAILLLIFALIKDKSLLKIEIKHLPYFVGTGVLSIAFFNFCYFETIRLTNSVSISALLLYTAPIFVMIMSAILYKERLTKKKIICLIITMIGLCFITGVFNPDGEITPKALFFGIGSGFCYALYSIFGKKVTSIYSGLTITIYTFILASVVVVPISGVLNNVSLIFKIDSLFYALGLSLVCTITPFLLYTKGLLHLDAGKAAVFATIEPITAVLVGLILFDEIMTISKFIGILLILVAITVLNLKGNDKNE